MTRYIVGEVRADRTAEGGVLYELKSESYIDQTRPQTGQVVELVEDSCPPDAQPKEGTE
jgi:hypothetical protein